MHAPNIRPDTCQDVRNLALALRIWLAAGDHRLPQREQLNMRYVDGNNTAEKLSAALQVFKSVTEECSGAQQRLRAHHRLSAAEQGRRRWAAKAATFAQNVIVLSAPR
jgi:hypothetical protein